MQQNTYLRFSSLCRLLGDCCLHACLFIDLSLFVVLHFICLFFIWYIFTIVACDMLFRQIAVKVYIMSGCYSAWSFCTCHFLIPELWYAHKLLLDELIVPCDPQPHGQVMASVFDSKLSANSGLSGQVSVLLLSDAELCTYSDGYSIPWTMFATPCASRFDWEFPLHQVVNLTFSYTPGKNKSETLLWLLETHWAYF